MLVGMAPNENKNSDGHETTRGLGWGTSSYAKRERCATNWN